MPSVRRFAHAHSPLPLQPKLPMPPPAAHTPPLPTPLRPHLPPMLCMRDVNGMSSSFDMTNLQVVSGSPSRRV